MKTQTLATALVFVALLGGSFAAGFAFLAKPRADSSETVQPQVNNAPPPAPEPRDPVKPAPPPQPNDPVEKRPEKKLARADVSQAGDSCIGRRVTWVCQSKVSQSDAGHTQHILFAEGTAGEFLFDNVFIAEEPEPFRQSPGWRVLEEARKRFRDDAHQRSEDLRRSKQKRPKGKARQDGEEYRKLHPLVVTGTIARLDTLILLGHGKRHDVPVLKNITIISR